MITQRPIRTLSDHPDLSQLKRQAKDLLKSFAAGEHDAATEVHAHYRDARVDTFALHDAQLVIARAYGFESWPRLKAFVDGATVRALCDAVRADDLDSVQAMVTARPELVTMDLSENDERTALHVAVLHQRPAIVRFLVERGADPFKGIWPHRDATSPLTIANERAYAEIAAIIRDAAPKTARGISSSSVESPTSDRPLQSEAHDARTAIAAGDLGWMRAHLHPSTQSRHLVSHAVRVRRPDALTQLLDLGFDPDEKERVEGLDEVVWSWGEPLRECALSGQLPIATLLLERGANPNTNVYAASSAMSEALSRTNAALVQLLERHGGVVNATTAGYLGLADRARQLLADAAVGVVPEGVVAPGDSVPRAMLESATDGGHVDIVRMALEHLDWLSGDIRWQGMLMRPFGRHTEADRQRYFDCFHLILNRSGVQIPWGFGRSTLHDVAAAWPRSSKMGPEERIGFATRLLDAGARLDVRDELLESTPLGWACRWGRLELVRLLLERGADPVERDAAPWATPLAWAEKMHHAAVVSELRKYQKAK